jgi:hypothetical protein
MRTYGRITNADGSKTWVQVTTDADGYDDMVWVTTLCQVLQLNLNESPFFANYGIPAHESIVTQVFPDYYVAVTQSQFAQYFASLIIAKVPGPDPVYNINIITNKGVKINASIPVPI